ncbi:MAG: glycosyltransferase family 2 protein [Proteobacteria bacterium]|nr:glycosyltransferase family 2 protein [Pseudomonadota bacterium]
MNSSLKKLVSIVISVYNEEKNLLPLYKELIENLEKCPQVTYELIFVNDGSADGSLGILSNLVAKNKDVRVVNFARNFGHEIAMTAGLDHSRGEAVIFMDADLQHPPHVVPKMIEKWLAGHDVVLGKITTNEDKTAFRRLLSKAFYRVVNFISDVNIPENTPDFRLIAGDYVTTIKNMRENSRMFRGMLNWLGIFNAVQIEFVAPKRLEGKTNYNFVKSMRLAIDSIIQFSIKPLRLSIYFSIICALASLSFGLITIYEHYVAHQPSGYATIICLITFLASLQFVLIGILGEYIGRIHIESRDRPLYFAKIIERNEAKN